VQAKIVFSESLAGADWNNSTLVAGDAAATINELKQQPGKDLALLAAQP
jgi:hypothetical protein